MGTPRKGAKNGDEEDEGSSFLSTASSPLPSRSRLGTPVADPPPYNGYEESPSRPSTARTGTPSRKLRNSTSVDIDDDAPSTTRSGTPIRSSILAATPPQPSTPRRGPPRLSKGSSFTSTTTLESASSVYSPRSSFLESASTPPSSTDDDDTEGLTDQLKNLAVGDKNDSNVDLNEQTESAPESPKMLTRANTDESVASLSPLNPVARELKNYVPKKLDSVAAAQIRAVLPAPPGYEDCRGYVYMFRVTPRYPQETLSEEDKKMIIIKVGCSSNPKNRIRKLNLDCKYYRHESFELYQNKIEETVLKYKTEQLVHKHLTNRKHQLAERCLCDNGHRELFRVPEEELKNVYSSIKHWTKVVNEQHNRLWPGAVRG